MARGAKGALAPRLGFWIVAVLAVLTAVASLRSLTFDPNVIADALRQNLLDRPLPFWIHTITGPLALLLGIFQFLPATRRNAYHRWSGRIYVAACLIGGVSAFIIAFTTSAGPVAAAGFVILSLLWMGATVIAVTKAVQRDFRAHRAWMIRSYALTAAAITLRLILAVGTVADQPFMRVYIFSAWACWIINLVIAEVIISRRPAPVGPLRPAELAATRV